ncbi:MAG: imelysin [Prevotella sp.]|nr:imelysin [Prevotella sp.]
MKKIFYFAAVLLMGLTFTACSSDDDNKGNDTETKYQDKTYGNAAMDACDNLGSVLVKANTAIATAQLTDDQEAFLYEVLNNLVDNVIVPTYTKLADDTEDLEQTLKGLTVNTITQDQINKACADFKAARENWERSEAFLGGAAADFDVDPTIDSWPLNRSLLLTYLRSGRTDFSNEEIEDATILGFHALEFLLFRNGQPRKVSEFKNNDTYTGFSAISGASELAYAQRICTLLKERTFQLQVAWEGEKNASRAAVVKAANLEYTTSNGLSFGDNMKQAGKNPKSTFTSLTDAIAQVLSDDEGSCFGICNEVGTAKIANPFANGDIAYVESPYSYNSITDFADNIRSIRNVWLGSTTGSAATYSFHAFFASAQASTNTAVENAYTTAVSNISKMPAPFVKYCSIVSGKNFDDPDNWDSITEE